MKKVIIESPYAGDTELNVKYARAALRDSLLRGEAPLASHLLYTQEAVLDDDIPGERTMGIEAGLAWGGKADATVVYIDLGMSIGMHLGIERAEKEGRPVFFRLLRGWGSGCQHTRIRRQYPAEPLRGGESCLDCHQVIQWLH